MWFLTEYEPFPVEPILFEKNGGTVGKYVSHVWAKSWKDADRVCAFRRIGEIVVGQGGRRRSPRPEPLPSQLLKKRMTHNQKIDFIHSVCFLSFLLMQSTGAPTHGVLGDDGLLHQAIHCMIGVVTRKSMKATLTHFESMVPGL